MICMSNGSRSLPLLQIYLSLIFIILTSILFIFMVPSSFELVFLQFLSILW